MFTLRNVCQCFVDCVLPIARYKHELNETRRKAQATLSVQS